MKPEGIGVFALCTVLMAACASDGTRPEGIACPTEGIVYPLESTLATDLEYRGLTSEEPNTLSRLIADKLAPRRDGESRALVRPRSLLALSGGGQWGAYGAGFLNGWTADDSRRDFDVVTGVSTGALIAPLAFLGPDFDEELAGAYTIVDESDLVTRRFLLSALFSNSLYKRKGLEDRVRELIDEHFLRLLSEAERGRGLYVGVVDADSGDFAAVDLLALARSEIDPAQKEACFEGYLLASTSVPAAFPPVFVEETDSSRLPQPRLLVDGGVRHLVFYEELERAARILQKRKSEADLHIVINGELDLSAVTPNNHLLDIALRSVGIVVHQVSVGSLERLVQLGRDEGWTVRYTSARGHACETQAENDKGEQFKPRFMQCLMDYAAERWQQGDPWDRSTSPMQAKDPTGE